MNEGLQLFHKLMLDSLRVYRDFHRKELDRVEDEISKLTFKMQHVEAEAEKLLHERETTDGEYGFEGKK